MPSRLLKVKAVNALFPIGFTRIPLPLMPELQEQFSRPMIELVLEDDRTLKLMGIPHDIAIEIWLITNNKPYKSKKDYRLSLAELVTQLGTIERVVISDVVPDLGVYVANVDIKIGNGDSAKKITVKMIPSHAILLALKSKADIYVAEKLIKLDLSEGLEELTEEKTYDEQITYW